MVKQSVQEVWDAKLQRSCVYLEHTHLLIAIVGILLLPKGRAYDFH